MPVTSWETRSPHSLTPGGSGLRPGSLITLNLPDFNAQVGLSVYRTSYERVSRHRFDTRVTKLGHQWRRLSPVWNEWRQHTFWCCGLHLEGCGWPFSTPKG